MTQGQQRPQDEGAQWTEGGIRYTVNPTDDPRAQGGYYLSMTDLATGGKATAVYNADGTFANVKANRPQEWWEMPTQQQKRR